MSIEHRTSQALGLRLEPDSTLISFYRLDTGEKLLTMDEWYEQSEERQAELMAERSTTEQIEAALIAERLTTEGLQQQLDRYRAQFGEL